MSVSCARDALSALGDCLYAVLTEGVGRVVEDESRPGARSHYEDNGHQARVWWPGD